MNKRAAGRSEAVETAIGRPSAPEPAIFAVRPTPTNLSTLAYDRISGLIHKRELQSGEVVVEQNLAAYLGISRTPVRQALQRLELEGLLVKSQTKSFVVRKVELKEYLQSLKAREIMESEAAASCVHHVPPDRINAAKQTLERLRRSTEYDQEEHWESDKEVHDIVAEFCGNQVVCDIVKSLRVTTKLFEIERLAERLEPDTRQHEKIIEMIEAKDAKGAKRAMLNHIKSLYRFALDTVT